MYRRQLIGFVLLAALLNNTALGYDDDLFELPLDELLQVTITSTSYFDQSLMESASSVTYSDASRWDELGARNVGELLNTLPSTVAPQGYGRTRVIAIRGYFNYSIDTGVATLLDGVPINLLRFGTSALAIDGHDLALLDSVELIRGPGSSLHGADAFQGVLSMNTVAHGETGVTTRLQAGSEDFQAGSLVSRYSEGSQQLTTALAYRNLGNQHQQYSYTDPDTGLPEQSSRMNALENQNIVIKYSATDAHQNRYQVSGYHMKLDADQLPGVARQSGVDLMKDQDWAGYDARLSLLKLEFEHDFNEELSSSVVAYYWDYKDQDTLDLREVAPSPFNFYQQVDTQEHHWGVQAINRHQFAGGSNLAYGYEFNRAENDAFTTTRVTQSGSRVVSPNNQQGAETEYHSLVLDGRYQSDLLPEQRSTFVYGSRVDAFRQFDTQISPRLGYIHGLSSAAVAKLIVSRSFRNPNTFETYGSNSVLPNQDLEPETLDNIELTLQHSNKHHFGSVTLFKNRWRNSIRAVPLATPVNGATVQFDNTTESEAWGVELEGMQRWNQLRLDGSASHVISRDLEDNQEYEAFPDWMLNLGVGYAVSDVTDVYLFNRYHHRKAASVAEYGYENTQGSSTFFRTDLTVSWQWQPDLTTRFTIRNLFDRENYMPSYFDRQDGLADNGINASLSIEWQPFGS
ncbi:TonB-dependent receptor plug domain-containing protein [Ketobacter alkanivorans]|uniref:TonB-dependent receptor n=1 Tax=Ketobacter alkanivorans TaxID=1917421 RepID=A0A2K9LQ79_9GAMM|nr:TonB-dependent receptor [Ketobacter alkanivorans]AUM12984.1 hypothetical protein Kalk_11355 [Ketobacter alkanivorans]